MDPTVAYRIKTFDSVLHIAVFPIEGGSAYEKTTLDFTQLGVEPIPDTTQEFHDEPVVKFNCKNPSGMTTFDIRYSVDLQTEELHMHVEDHIGAVYRHSKSTHKLRHLGLQPIDGE